MKRLEDIENLSALDLERIASDESIMVPEMLKHDIECTSRALKIMAEKQEPEMERTARKRVSIFSYAAAAVALIAVTMTLSFHEPKDTFDDPMLAYAQLEQTFGFISEKVSTGLDIADKAEPVFEKTINALK